MLAKLTSDGGFIIVILAIPAATSKTVNYGFQKSLTGHNEFHTLEVHEFSKNETATSKFKAPKR